MNHNNVKSFGTKQLDESAGRTDRATVAANDTDFRMTDKIMAGRLEAFLPAIPSGKDVTLMPGPYMPQESGYVGSTNFHRAQ